ncbi:ABC transporter permease [Pseudomonas sp. GCM10022186]|uniref:ABC transporter permease n=1 Tax=Pseudomonas sp. GCM10022186 TaxID=3252650 RepID=UPI00361158F8
MTLIRTLLWRLLAGVGVLWGAATLTFVTLNATGGDTALAILGGPEALPTEEVLARVRSEYGLDQPLLVQYGQYLGRLAQGDLGESYRLRIPVTRAIAQQVGATALLAGTALVVAVFLSIGVAVTTARRSRWLTSLASGGELVLSSMPSFVLGILLLLLFSFRFPIFPAAGSQGWESLVLPTLTLALPVAAILTQVLRQELEDILEQPFIVMARARGLSEAGVRLGHALRHALIPLVTLSGFIFATLLGGAVITETLFARQGVGRLMIEATTNKDVPLVIGITLLAALIYVVINLLVDLLNGLVDPRVARP